MCRAKQMNGGVWWGAQEIKIIFTFLSRNSLVAQTNLSAYLFVL